MEHGARTTWTDERLDDLAESMRSGFARVDQDLREVRTEIANVRLDLGAQIEGLRQTLLRVGGGMLVGFISVLAAVLARGG